jgi:threonylcarbamoyladenosine tRNA methylthiotransferase MtaB
VAALSLGCKVNAYDTEAMLALFAQKGYEIVPFDSRADVYLINTCTVTNIGDKKSRQMIRRACKQNEEAIVVACGCYSQLNPEEAGRIPGVSLILGTGERGRVVELVEQLEHRRGDRRGAARAVADIARERAYEPITLGNGRLTDRTRAFIKIEDGCDRFCTYCAIPYARGPVRSRRPEQVLAEVEKMAALGCKEIVLAGIHVASYGKDLKDMDTNLASLLTLVHEIKGIQRLRFSSMEPTLMDGSFLRVIRDLPKVCDHFHLSLQSGCDATLKRMNRRYGVQAYRQAIEGIRAAFPRTGLTTDMIVGFPGETDKEFAESCAFAEEMQFSKIHVFPFSAKKGTPAAGFPDQMPEPVKAERARRLTAISDKAREAFLRQWIGRTLSVLFEQQSAYNLYEGHAANYARIKAAADHNAVNQIWNARVLSVEGDWLNAELIDRAEE